MYLWRIKMSLASRSARDILTDTQKMHQRITDLFDSSRKDGHLLYRYKISGTALFLYISSSIPILKERIRNDMELTGSKDMSDWLDSMTEGKRMRFEIVTLPSKKVKNPSGHSRREYLKDHETRLNWLLTKGQQNGFSILAVQENPAEGIYCKHKSSSGGTLRLPSWRYSGVLQVEDAELFKDVVQKGLGPEKAYGLGMLLVA